jgi:predicted PurR-regulated permease PerM
MALFIMVVAILYFGKEVLLPITLALLLAFILSPLVDRLRRLRLGRGPSVMLAVIFALGVVVAIGGVIGSQIADLTADLPQYTQTVRSKITAVNSFTVGRLSRWADQLGRHNAKPQPAAEPMPGQSAPVQPRQDQPKPVQPEGQNQQQPQSQQQPQGQAQQQPQPQPQEQPQGQPQSPPQPRVQPAAAPASPQSEISPMKLAGQYMASVLSPLATLAIVFVVTVFALLQREDLRNRLIRLIGSHDLHDTTVAIDDGARRLSRYFVTQLIINTIFGIVIGLGLLAIGLPHPVLFGILSGLLRFVPYVGSFISAAFPLALAAAVDPGWHMVLWTAILYGIVEPVTGQFIEPMVYGNSTGLSPFSVIVAAIFWSWLWGPVGLLLSTPLTLCLVVIGRHAKRLEFLDIVLGDRPALTPAEIFYQRILAGDPDELLDQAEILLKDISLSNYYDEVALRGLQRADRDTRIGRVDRAMLTQVKHAADTLIGALDRHGDARPKPLDRTQRALLSARSEPGVYEQDVPRKPDPAGVSAADDLGEAWRHSPAVLCIAGRGPLDEVATAMLVQLLAKHGMPARLVRYDEAARQRIGTLDVSGIAMACVCCLDMTGSPAYMRYLVQRLSERLPDGAPILVGLWSAGDPILKDDQARAAIGARYLVATLEQAVSACAEAARRAGHRDTGQQRGS